MRFLALIRTTASLLLARKRRRSHAIVQMHSGRLKPNSGVSAYLGPVCLGRRIVIAPGRGLGV